MKVTRYTPFLAGLLIAAVLFAALTDVFAADNQGAYTLENMRAEGYIQDEQTAPVFQGMDGTGSVANVDTTVTTFLMRLKDTTGSNSPGVRQNVPVSLRFTNSGATATIFVVYYHVTSAGSIHILGIDQPISGGAVITLDATTAQDDTGRYMAHTYVFDSYAATHCAIICTAVSAGEVDAWVGSF